MLEAKPCGQVTVNDEPTLMERSMMRRTQQHQVRGAMIDTLGTRAQVMDVAIAVPAPRNHTAAVAPSDQAPHLGRNVLRGARDFGPMGAKI